MRLLPASPRQRRRLAWTGWTLVVVAGAALAVVLMPRGEPVPQTPLRTTAEEVAPARPPLRLTAARRREIDEVVSRFAREAVGRRDPAAAWNDVSVGMRASVSRAEWNAGNLPGIVPFDPAALADVSWRVVYREPERVGLDVLLVAKRGSRQRSLVYAADLVLERGRLLVDVWAPRATLAGGGGGATATATTTTAEPAAARGKLDTRWLLVPAGLLALAVVAPLVLLAVSTLRNRRAHRHYERAAR